MLEDDLDSISTESSEQPQYPKVTYIMPRAPVEKKDAVKEDYDKTLPLGDSAEPITLHPDIILSDQDSAHQLPDNEPQVRPESLRQSVPLLHSSQISLIHECKQIF